MNLTFRQLRVFNEVARQGSLARAAEALHLTPPAVSMQIKELEGQVGLPLLDRGTRSATLTSAGEYFLVHARRLLADLKDAQHAMARLRKLEQGVLVIGVVSTAKYFVPHLLARFHEEHPAIDVKLRVAANREQLVALMDAGEADLSIMGRPPRELGARAESFAPHPLVFVAPARHPLVNRHGVDGSISAIDGDGANGANSANSADGASARRAPITLAELADHPMIVREAASGTRSTLDALLAQHRVEPRITMEMPSNESIKQAVIAGMGISFLSLHTVGLELRNGLMRVLPVEGTPLMRAWHVVHLRAKVLSPAAEAFRYFILEHGPAWLQAHDEGLMVG
jgi:DNA-binding transcriptional LysR family regulator